MDRRASLARLGMNVVGTSSGLCRMFMMWIVFFFCFFFFSFFNSWPEASEKVERNEGVCIMLVCWKIGGKGLGIMSVLVLCLQV